MLEGGRKLFYLADMGGGNLYSSPGLTDFTGTDIFGHSWFDIIHPDDLATCRSVFGHAQRTQQTFAGWWRLRRYDDAYIWCMVDGSVCLSEVDCQPIGYVGSVTPLRRADAFDQAGGVLGPERTAGVDFDARDDVARLERLADTILMASALAREGGETPIAKALDAALMKIGFRLAEAQGSVVRDVPPTATLPLASSDDGRR